MNCPYCEKEIKVVNVISRDCQKWSVIDLQGHLLLDKLKVDYPLKTLATQCEHCTADIKHLFNY